MSGESGKRRGRPCAVCRRWFEPSPRARGRQRVCSRPECQRERHRRACAAWHGRHPGWDRENRLRKRLVREDATPAGGPGGSDPRRQIAWDVVRDAVGVEVTAVVEETAGVLVNWARDAVMAQGIGLHGKSARMMVPVVRDVKDWTAGAG